MPEMALKCIDSWKKFCPDYQIIEWNENNFPMDSCDYVKEAYEAKKWAFVSDVARLRALVECGGIYMDIDVEIVKPLDDLLEYEAVSGFESPSEITTAFMACEKGNTLFQEFLQSYEGVHFIGKDGEYDLTTNVERITRICKKYGFVENNQQQNIQNYWLFPKDYFSPKSYITKEIELTENTYVIHHFDGSWYTEEIKYRNRLIDKLIKIMPYRMASYIATFLGELKYKGIKKSMKRIFKWIKKKV